MKTILYNPASYPTPPRTSDPPSNDTTSSSTISQALSPHTILHASLRTPAFYPHHTPLICSFSFPKPSLLSRQRTHLFIQLPLPSQTLHPQTIFPSPVNFPPLHSSLPLHSQKLFPPFISPHSIPCQKHTHCTNPPLLFHEYTFSRFYIFTERSQMKPPHRPARCYENNTLQPSFLPNTPTHFRSPPSNETISSDQTKKSSLIFITL